MILVVCIVAVWAVVTIDGWYRYQPDPPATEREPGWVLAEARRRRGDDLPNAVRILGPTQPAPRVWTAPIPDEPVTVEPLDPDEQWENPEPLHTIQLKAVNA